MSATSTSHEVRLSTLIKRPVLDPDGHQVGRVIDVIVELRRAAHPLLHGLVVHTGNHDAYVPAAIVGKLGPDRVALTGLPESDRSFERRPGEVLLRADVLAHRLLDIGRARLVHAYDIALAQEPGGSWIVTGVDVHRGKFWQAQRRHPAHPTRDWAGFEPLIGHLPSVRFRTGFGLLRRLKPAQIADLLESAGREEQTEILQHVHTDPEFEADVFEELDDEQQSRLLASRSDAEISGVLSRMRPDDAMHAIVDLPQERRQPVLAALPDDHRRKVTTLLGYNETTAGGLRGVDYFTQPPQTTAREALTAIRHTHTNQPEALVTIYLTDIDGRLVGAIGLVTALQAEPETALRDLADVDPVRVHADADVVDVITRMADYNLLTLPVVDHDHKLLGVITIDDVLEAVIPDNWRRRDAGAPTTTHFAP